MLYGISATVTKRTQGGDFVIQVPTFYLDSAVQGILGEDHAKVIAQEIINPTKDLNLTVNIFIYAADRFKV